MNALDRQGLVDQKFKETTLGVNITIVTQDNMKDAKNSDRWITPGIMFKIDVILAFDNLKGNLQLQDYWVVAEITNAAMKPTIVAMEELSFKMDDWSFDCERMVFKPRLFDPIIDAFTGAGVSHLVGNVYIKLAGDFFLSDMI